MPMPLTWAAMRGDRLPRDWYRRSDLLEAARAICPAYSDWNLRQVLRRLPRPQERRYGHLHYGQEHLDAVVAAAGILLDELQATPVP